MTAALLVAGLCTVALLAAAVRAAHTARTRAANRAYYLGFEHGVAAEARRAGLAANAETVKWRG